MREHLFGDGSEQDWGYAERALRDFRVEKTQELHDYILEMGRDIYSCPVRNSNKRTLQQVLASCMKTVMEHALCDLAGLEKNTRAFDKRDPLTYHHDASDGSVMFEVKSFKSKWFSWRGDKPVATFLKHKDELGYLVSGCMLEHEDHFAGKLLMLARAPTFDKYIKASQNPGSSYYDHKRAGSAGQCIYRQEIA